MHHRHVICGGTRAHEPRTFSKASRKSWICGAMKKDFELAQDGVRQQMGLGSHGCQAFISTWPTSSVTVPLAHYSRVQYLDGTSTVSIAFSQLMERNVWMKSSHVESLNWPRDVSKFLSFTTARLPTTRAHSPRKASNLIRIHRRRPRRSITRTVGGAALVLGVFCVRRDV